MLFLLLAVLLLAAAVGCGEKSPDLPEKTLAEALKGAEYVGDEACASCHGETYAAYHRTGMGRSFSRFDQETAPEKLGPETRVYDENKDFYYEAFLQGDSLYQREFRLGEAGQVVYDRTYPAAWVIGSGHATRSYLMNVNGYITEMPLTWYVDRQRWDLSPGYESFNSRFERPINEECMTCHNGRAEHSDFTQGHYTDVPLGITCERCHGPGSQHVEARLSGLGPPAGEVDSTIVNPAHLNRDLQLSVCQQCHLTGVTVLKPGEEMASYRPGEPLAAHRSVFVRESELEDPAQFGIASHAMRLARSACFQKSDMTCTTCHDPHTPLEEMGADHFNTACKSCHTPDPASEPVCSREQANTIQEAMAGECVSCHMQQSGTSDIPHVTFTDHWIRRYLPEERGPSAPDTLANRKVRRQRPFNLVRVTKSGQQKLPDESVAALEEAIAYYEFYETQDTQPVYLDRAIRRARKGLAGGAEHPEGRLALGRALIEQDALKEAEAVLAEAARRYPEHARILYWLGTVRHERGRPREAVAPLKKAWNVQPALVEAGLKLGQALDDAGQLDNAARVLQEVVRRNPVHLPEAWNNLGFIYLRRRRLEEALDNFEKALALQPDMAEALVNAGSIHLMRQEYDEAAAFFERSTRADTSYAPAFGNLGVVYARQGQHAKARRMLERVLELKPGDRRARALLQQLSSRGESAE